MEKIFYRGFLILLDYLGLIFSNSTELTDIVLMDGGSIQIGTGAFLKYFNI